VHKKLHRAVYFGKFIRRDKPNSSKGTDHGKGGVLFVAGGSVNGGVYGSEPRLAEDQLVEGDLADDIDFRRVYSDAAAFIGANAAELVGPGFTPLGVV